MAITTVSEEILSKLFRDNECDERYELVDGTLRPKAMTSIFHSMMMARLGRLLDELVGDDPAEIWRGLKNKKGNWLSEPV